MSSPVPETDLGPYRRFLFLLVLIACGFGVLTFRAFSISVLHRSEYLQRGERSARLRYPLPAPRGRILDRNGVVLAWSERRFALFHTGSQPLSEELLQELENVLDHRPPAGAGPCLAHSMNPGQLMVLDQLIHNGAPLRIVPLVERHSAGTVRAKAAIGKVETRQEELYGISGLEAQYDELLRGTQGAFSVIVDRHRKWVPSSWRLEQTAVPGRDVKIPQSLAELEGKGQ